MQLFQAKTGFTRKATCEVFFAEYIFTSAGVRGKTENEQKCLVNILFNKEQQQNSHSQFTSLSVCVQCEVPYHVRIYEI